MVRTAAVLALAAASSAACASAGGGETVTGSIQRNGEDAVTVLVVENASAAHFDVHVLHAGHLHRLGRVMGKRTVEFDLPHAAALADGFYMIVQPVGTRVGYLSSLFHAASGERVATRIDATVMANAVALRST